MTAETYQYWLHANAGRTEATLKFLDNGEVELEFGWRGMGTPYQYRLYGKNELLSDSYGRIHIRRVENTAASPNAEIPVQVLFSELIYEYVKVTHSPTLQHPEDMLWLSASWTEFFDLILFTNSFSLEGIDTLKYALAQEVLDADDWGAEMLEHINEANLEHLTSVLVVPDKMKFAKVATTPPDKSPRFATP